MAQKEIEERLDVTDAKQERIKKEVQKLLATKRNLAKLMETSDETMKALAAIATEMTYWRTRTLVSTIVTGQKSRDDEGTSAMSKEVVCVSTTLQKNE